MALQNHVAWNHVHSIAFLSKADEICNRLVNISGYDYIGPKHSFEKADVKCYWLVNHVSTAELRKADDICNRLVDVSSVWDYDL